MHLYVCKSNTSHISNQITFPQMLQRNIPTLLCHTYDMITKLCTTNSQSHTQKKKSIT